MATVTMTLEEYEALIAQLRSLDGELAQTTSSTREQAKPRRKRSKYNRELSKQLKLMKAKHPRTAITKLMKKAHRATRKALKL